MTKNCFNNYKYDTIKELNNLGGSGFARLHSKITHYPFNSNPFISFSLISFTKFIHHNDYFLYYSPPDSLLQGRGIPL